MARQTTALSIANRIALPVLGRLGGTRFWRRANDLRRWSADPVEAREARQVERLSRLLREAAPDVPLLRERLPSRVLERGIGSLDELASLPVTTKDELSEGFPDRVTHATADRASWRYVATSGTVSRVVTVKDFERRDWERAAMLHALREGAGYRPGLRLLQIPPNICHLVCGEAATNERESFRGEFLRWTRGKTSLSDLRGAFERRVIYRMRMLDPLAQADSDVEPARLRVYWKRIREERPYLLHALPEYLYFLAEWAIEEGLPPLGVPRLLPMGGATSPFMRERIAEGLGGVFLDFYGTAELGPVAFESVPGHGLRPIAELFLVEVVRPDGTPAAPGELGRILLTDLENRAMPFLRYEVGDVGYWRPPPSGARDQARRLRVVGRADEVLPDGRGGLVRPDTLRDALLREGGCRAFGLRWRGARGLQLDYVPRGSGGGSRERVEAVLRARVGPDVRLRLRAVRSVPAENSGKFRFVQGATREREAADRTPAL